LAVECDITDIFTEQGADYMSFKQGFEDLLNQVDEKYARSVAKLRGRKLDAAYRTETIHVGEGEGQEQKKRCRYWEVTPYPSVFMSKLAELKGDFYGSGQYRKGLLRKHNAIILHEEWHGRRKVCTYFLAEEEAGPLLEDVKKLNEQIDQLNKEIAEYECTDTFKQLMEYLTSKIPPANFSRYPVKSYIHHIQVKYFPLPINKQIVESYMDERVKEEVRKNLTEAVEKITESFADKMSDWMAKLAGKLAGELTSAEVQSMRKTLDSIQEETKRYQVDSLLGKQFRVCEALVKAMETRSSKEIEEATNAIATDLGIPMKDTPQETLQEAVAKIRGIDRETRALISTMI
jgi:uncharacterized protein (DUF1810 family)